MKPHPIVWFLGIVLIFSAVVSLSPWRGDETTSKGLDSSFQIHQTLGVGAPHRPQNAITLPTQQYVGHAPISINKNADFAAIGFPGEGSPSNPYVITGLNIKASNTLIHIQDTTAYFRIQNNLLTGVGWESHGIIEYPDGIYLQNVVNGTINTNIITYCKFGIHLNGSEQTSVAHNTVSNCSRGIRLEESWHNNLTHNTLSNNYFGIRLLSSGQNTLVGNNLINNGLDISGDHVEDCLQATVAENVVNGRPVVYWQSVSGGTVPPGAGQVLLINTTGIEVTGQNLSWTSIGVLTAFSSHLDIHHNTLSNNSYRGISLSHSRSGNNSVVHNTLLSNSAGISLWDARHTTISNNTLSHNRFCGVTLMYSEHNTIAHNTLSDGGICLEESGYNTVAHNTVSYSCGGISIRYRSRNNTIAHNIVSNSRYVGIGLHWYAEYNTVANNTVANLDGEGIRLTHSGHNTLFNNTITDCEEEGIGIWDSWHNTVAHNTVAYCGEGIVLQWSDSRNNTVTWNDFLRNHPGGGGRYQARDNSPNNVFTNNYWDDHDKTDRNGDGIADAPYPIFGVAGNQDPFPLTTPANTPHFLRIPIIVYPNGGETLQGMVMIKWIGARDSLGHPVTYTITYSSDNGNTWMPLVSGLSTTSYSYEWNTTTVANGAEYRIQVVATCADGLWTEDHIDAPFSIRNIAHSLSVPTILFPNGDETLQGMVTLHWTLANDTWEHSVTYTVSYSLDNGHDWILLASGLSTSEYEWDTTAVADGSVYRVQVVATCSEGLTAEDVSDAPFIIQNLVVTTPVGAFPVPGMPVAMHLVTLLLLLAMHAGRRGKRQAR